MSICCKVLEWMSDPVTIAVYVGAVYVGWNLTDWWRALKKSIYQCTAREKEYVRETLNPYQRPLGGLGSMMGNDPHPNRFYQQQHMANQCNPDILMRHMGYASANAPPPPKKPGEKVVEGEVIRGEPLRVGQSRTHDYDKPGVILTVSIDEILMTDIVREIKRLESRGERNDT